MEAAKRPGPPFATWAIGIGLTTVSPEEAATSPSMRRAGACAYSRRAPSVADGAGHFGTPGSARREREIAPDAEPSYVYFS